MVQDVAMRRGLRRLVEFAALKGTDAGQSMADIEGIRDLALLAVADTVDPGRDLLRDDIAHRGCEPLLERRLVEIPAHLAGFEKGEQLARPRQAADMRGQDPVGAA